MKEKIRVTQQLEKIGEEICDHYCKFPQYYGNSDNDMERLHEEHCENCPIYLNL